MTLWRLTARLASAAAILLASVVGSATAFAAEGEVGGVGAFDHGNQYAWIFTGFVMATVTVWLWIEYRRLMRGRQEPRDKA